MADSGDVYVWGKNDHGELGFCSSGASHLSSPHKSAQLSGLLDSIMFGFEFGLAKTSTFRNCFVANPPESGEILTWGISSQFTDESSKICEPPHILELPKNYRAIMAFCGRYHAVTVVALKLPTWSFLKPLLVGWQRDTNCCFHHSKGIPLHIVQLIVEFTWECELPTPLAVLCNKSLTTC